MEGGACPDRRIPHSRLLPERTGERGPGLDEARPRGAGLHGAAKRVGVEVGGRRAGGGRGGSPRCCSGSRAGSCSDRRNARSRPGCSTSRRGGPASQRGDPPPGGQPRGGGARLRRRSFSLPPAAKHAAHIRAARPDRPVLRRATQASRFPARDPRRAPAIVERRGPPPLVAGTLRRKARPSDTGTQQGHRGLRDRRRHRPAGRCSTPGHPGSTRPRGRGRECRAERPCQLTADARDGLTQPRPRDARPPDTCPQAEEYCILHRCGQRTQARVVAGGGSWSVAAAYTSARAASGKPKRARCIEDGPRYDRSRPLRLPALPVAAAWCRWAGASAVCVRNARRKDGDRRPECSQVGPGICGPPPAAPDRGRRSCPLPFRGSRRPGPSAIGVGQL